MSDAFERLERQIAAALPAHAAPTRRPRRLGGSRRRLLVVALAAILGGSAVATAQLVDQGTVVKPRSENLDLAQSFALFRRPATDQDVLRNRRGVPDPKIAGTTRLVLTDGERHLYANNAGDGRLCLYLQSPAIAVHTCTAQDQAVAGSLPPSLTMLDATGSSTYLLLPDGAPTVTATTTAGRTTTVPAIENGVVLPRDTDRAAWSTADGEHHQLDHLAPALPRMAQP